MISKQAENHFKARVIGKSSDRLIKMIVNGNSMWPFLRHGQKISVRKLIRREDVSIGDIAVIKVRNFFLIHRVLFKRMLKDRDGWEYFTKGDWRFVADGWIDAKNIVGFMPTSRMERILKSLIAGYSFCLILFGKIIRKNAA